MSAPPEEKPTPTLEQLAQAVDDVVRRADEAGVRDLLTEGLEAQTALHSAGVIALVRGLRDDLRGRELLFDLVDVPEVRMALTLLGVLRPDPTTTASRALDQVRPVLQSHGGDASLVRLEDGVAHVRLEGACNGCSMASVTLRETVEAALVGPVPGVTSVQVVQPEAAPTVIPLSSITVRPPDGSDAAREAERAQELAAAGWTAAVGLADLAVGDLRTATADGTDVVVVRSRTGVVAYVDRCAHQGLPLDGAIVDPESGTLTCAWHGFCYDVDSGECTSMPGAQLEQVPVTVEAGRVWVRGPHPAGVR
ncbi:MAG: hypothetical protein CMH83_13985 [Nocardioides sp.]|nr:hypothetical protein [Nocardioides sp.]